MNTVLFRRGNATEDSGISAYLNQNVLNSPTVNEDVLGFNVTKRNYRKNEVIRWEGRNEDKVYFIRKGQVELSFEKDEELRILSFYFENDWFADYHSLITGSSSELRITATSDCEIEYFSYQEMIEAYNSSITANAFGRHLMEQVYLTKSLRERELLTLTPVERFQSLLKKNPDVLMMISAKKVAAYLGIKPESLSRIRKRLFMQKRSEKGFDKE